MKQLILLACLLLCFASASATHIRGGYITFKADTTQNPNPRRFFFNMVIYMDGTAQADHPEVQMSMGDGNTITVERKTGASRGPSIGYQTDLNVYEWEYTYGADGNYTISWTGVNRNPGILNITPPSDQLSFYLATTINVNALRGFNSSPRLLAPSPLKANLGQALHYNFTAYDPEGDSISYRLITPLQSNPTANIIPVTGYTLPGHTFKCSNSTATAEAEFSFSERDGQLVWNAPCRKGEYAFAVALEEWRNGVKLSMVSYDMQIIVTDIEDSSLSFTKQENQKYTPEGYVVAKINQEIELQVVYNNMTPINAPVTIGKEAKLFSSELYHLLNVPVTYTLETTKQGTVGKFRFTPSKNLIRKRPYFVSFYGGKDNFPLTTSVGIVIRSDQPLFELLKPAGFARSEDGHITVSPNSQVKLKVFAENFERYTTSLSIESLLAAGAEKFAITTRDSTEGKISELLFQPGESQIAEAPQTITFKATYNPARIAGGRLAAAGEPVVKEMQVQVIVAQQLPTATPEELAAATYLIYPNPAQDKFTVQAERPATLSIYSLQGKLILQQQLQPGSTEIMRPDTTSGLYFYTLTTQAGHKKTGKLVLQ